MEGGEKGGAFDSVKRLGEVDAEDENHLSVSFTCGRNPPVRPYGVGAAAFFAESALVVGEEGVYLWLNPREDNQREGFSGIVEEANRA